MLQKIAIHQGWQTFCVVGLGWFLNVVCIIFNHHSTVLSYDIELEAS